MREEFNFAEPDDDFVTLQVAARLTGLSQSRLWTLASAGILGGRRLGAARRWHVRRSLLADMPRARSTPVRSPAERPWLRLVVDNTTDADRNGSFRK